MNTWFKVYRSIFDSDIWNDVVTFRLFLCLIGKASHKDGVKVAGIELKKGQYIRSYRKLAEDLSYKHGNGLKQHSVNTIKKSIQKLIDAERVTTKETEKGTLFTIINYAFYQSLENIENDEVNRKENGRGTEGEQKGNKNKNYRIKELKNNKKNSRKRVYDEASIYYQLAVFFFQQIKNNNPDHKEPDFNVWSDDIRKMVELDKRTAEQVQYLMKWVQHDDFEMSNVLSPAKLRKRFDQLVMKVKRNQASNVIPIDENQKQKYNYGF